MTLKPSIIYDNDIFYLQKFGGIRNYFANLIDYLEYDSDAIELHQNSKKYNSLYPSNKSNIVDKACNISSIVKSFSLPLLASYQNSKPFIYHATYYRNPFLPLIKSPTVITIHDMIHELYPQYFDHSYRLKRLLYIHLKEFAIKSCDHIIAVSHSTKDDILRIYPRIRSEKISVIYHGSNFISQPKLNDIKARFSLKYPFVLYVGSRAHYKGFNYLFTAFQELSKKYNDLRLICAGPPLSRNEYIYPFINDFNNGKISFVTPNHLELSQLYSNTLLTVYPSMYEGFGFPIIEAMQCASPVLCTRIPSSIEIAGKYARYVDRGSSSQIYHSIEDVINNPPSSESLRIAQDYALDFTWRKCANLTKQLYTKLL